MEDHDKKKKSPHLQELEEVFDQRMRRFSAFEILGLTPEGGRKPPEGQASRAGPLEPTPGFDENTTVADEHTHEFDRHTGGFNRNMGVSDTPPSGGTTHIHGTVGSDTPTHGSDTPMSESEGPSSVPIESSITSIPTSSDVDRPSHGSRRPTPGSARPIPGMASTQDPVVVVNTTTTVEKPIPGMGLEDTPMDHPNGLPRRSQRPSAVSQRHTSGSDKPSLAPDTNSRAGRRDHVTIDQVTQLQGLPFADAVTAMQLGNQLGHKAGKVLAYLNTRRAPNHESYTIPVGYGQISGAAGVDTHYLRRKVLPKLAMLGLIGVARKSLDGTIYHLPHGVDYVRIVTGELSIHEPNAASHKPSALQESDLDMEAPQEDLVALPNWIDRERWGWLSLDSVRRLVQKAGSEDLASEKLEMILYNETHGPLERRVRSRRSVLAYYLSSPQTEIWPNDDGFETLEMRRAIWERDRARREKALAEEALQARQEADQAKFMASLSEAQLRWLKQEAKQRVDVRPASKFLQSRYPLYKAEEDQLTQEWMDRVTYGERVPAVYDPTR